MNKLVPLLLLPLQLLPAAAGATPPADLERSRVTVHRMQELGSRLMAHVADRLAEMGTPTEAEEIPFDPKADPSFYDWSACPTISAERLREVLATESLPELSATDGWGHPLEFCFDEAGLASHRPRFGVRSPGADGRFERATYHSGGFPVEESTHDIVWVNGRFLVGPIVGGDPPPGIDPSKITLSRIRILSNALMAYLTDEVWNKTKPPRTNESGSGSTEVDPEVHDWLACPAISTERMREFLVPVYLLALAEKDGWGHPLEFCVNLEEPFNRNFVFGVRSPGSDGRFETSTYHGGPFPPEMTDGDIVWMDGRYIRWPGAGASGE